MNSPRLLDKPRKVPVNLILLTFAFVVLAPRWANSQEPPKPDPKTPKTEQPAKPETKAQTKPQDKPQEESQAKPKEASKPEKSELKPWEQRWRQQFSTVRLRDKMDVETSLLDRFMSLVGLMCLVALCVALSNNRKAISWRLVGIGLGLQLVFGILMLRTSFGRSFFEWVNSAVKILLSYSDRGAAFLFGDLIGYPFARSNIAFSVLPTIIFFSSLMAVLYHLGVMQRVVQWMAFLMQKSMGTSGAETLSAAGNIFVGQTEAPLLIRPFVNDMTESELMAVMTGGFATVAGGVLAAYVSMLDPFFPGVAGHLLTASIMSAPAALVCAKIMIPEPDPKACATYGEMSQVKIESPDANIIDAAARGAGEGLKLALNVGAMLLAFIALIAIVDDLVSVGCKYSGLAKAMGYAKEPVTLSILLGKILSPLAFLMGVPWADADKVGSLLGTKTVVNEFVAYLQLQGEFAKNSQYMSQRSLIIVSYSLCGFANFASIAIQIGGISGIAPERRSDLARLGLRAMLAGNLAAFMTGTVAGMII